MFFFSPMSTMNAAVGSGGGGITFVGAVGSTTGTGSYDAVSAGVQNGDLVITAISGDSGAVPFSQSGMASVSTVSNAGSVVSQYTYGIWQSGDSNPSFSGSITSGSGVLAIFRGATTIEGSAFTTSNPGNPNPPSLTANGELWLALGHLDDDQVAMTAPTNYTIAGTGVSAGVGSSTAIAYRIASLSSDDPGAFSGGDDNWAAYTVAFS